MGRCFPDWSEGSFLTGDYLGRIKNGENQLKNVLTVLRDGLPPLTPVNAPANPKLTPPSSGPIGRAARL